MSTQPDNIRPDEEAIASTAGLSDQQLEQVSGGDSGPYPSAPGGGPPFPPEPGGSWTTVNPATGTCDGGWYEIDPTITQG